MILEAGVEVLHAAHREGVSVDLEHEGEHLYLVVGNQALHGHAVDMAASPVLEHELARNLLERRALRKGQVISADAYHAVDRRGHYVHGRIQVGRGGYHAVEPATERFQHRHHGIDSGHHLYHLLCGYVLELQVEARLEVLLGAGRIEALEAYVPYVRSQGGVGKLHATLPDRYISCHRIYLQFRIAYIGGLQPEVRHKVPRHHDERGHIGFDGVGESVHHDHLLIFFILDFERSVRKSFGFEAGTELPCGQQFVQIQPFGIQVHVKPKHAPACQCRAQSAEIAGQGQLRPAAGETEAVETQLVVVEGGPHVRKPVAQRKIGADHPGAPNGHGAVKVPVAHVAPEGLPEVDADVALAEILLAEPFGHRPGAPGPPETAEQ